MSPVTARYRLASFSLLLLAALFLSGEAFAARCYVDAASNGANDGSSWPDAFADLQAALADPDCTEIWVAAGVYKPTDDPDDRNASFNVAEGVSLHGGFAGHETDLGERDWRTNVTVLSGDIDGNDLVDEHGRVLGHEDLAGANSHSVLRVQAGQALVRIHGLHITGGMADREDCRFPNTSGLPNPDPSDEPAPDCVGGGVLIERANVELRDLSITGNLAGHGGGLMQFRGSADYARIELSRNRAYLAGGGMALVRVFRVAEDFTVPGQDDALPSAVLSDIRIHGNRAQHGGGLLTASSLYRSDGMVVASNQADESGGGICECFAAGFDGAAVRPAAAPAHDNLQVLGNWSGIDGGGISSSAGGRVGHQLIVYNGQISGNFAPRLGGGAFISGNTLTHFLFNTVISGNRAGRTIDPNLAQGSGGGLYGDGHVRIHNSILWNNADRFGTDSEDSQVAGIGGEFSRSLVQNCHPDDWILERCAFAYDNSDPAARNRDPDAPVFVAPVHPMAAPTTSGDYRFRPESPLLDAGISPPPYSLGQAIYDLPELDLDGKARIAGGAIDLGPWEGAVDLECPPDGAAYVRQGAAGAGDGTSWSDALPTLKASFQVRPPCEIHVASGAYFPSDSAGDRAASFSFPGGLTFLGGYPPEGGAPEERDWRRHPTVLSGDLGHDDNIDSAGITPSAADIRFGNAWSVIQINRQGLPLALDGFVVTGGESDASTFGAFAHSNSGSGLFVEESSVALRNLLIQGNHARDFGGGLFQMNAAQLAMHDTRVVGNRAGGLGGGIMVAGPTDAELHNVEILGNAGTGMFMSRFGPDDLPQASLTNVSVSGNSGGGGLRLDFVEPVTIVNSLIAGNANSGGTDAADANLDDNQPDSLAIRHSLIRGCNPGGNWNADCGIDGGGNPADADPLFVDAPDPESAPGEIGDLRLQENSPAVDAGDSAVNDSQFDLDGNPRVTGRAIDLGAWEWLNADVIFEDGFEQR